MSEDRKVDFVSTTLILISKDNKVLITKRAPYKAYPNYWCVPGGKIQKGDGYVRAVVDGYEMIYHSDKTCLRREIIEELNIDIEKDNPANYLCSIFVEEIGHFVMSFYLHSRKNAEDINIELCKELTEYKWITKEEVFDYNLIPDTQYEIQLAFKAVQEQ